jgi:hypothetical protein
VVGSVCRLESEMVVVVCASSGIAGQAPTSAVEAKTKR